MEDTNHAKTDLFAKIFPFFTWFKFFNLTNVRNDLLSGVTVALVLIPQSMAYAQLAGLPAYYGLYAAFLPPLVAAMFGSSYQLATGPVAVVSLMTSTALSPLATAGSENYIAYAIILALVVGVFQFLLGVLKLGLVVNFLSHPVVNGFTNAAALIIASSQLSKLFGVEVESCEHQYEMVYYTLIEAFKSTHWPTLALAVLAFAIMYFLKRLNRKIPNVLAAVLITTIIAKFTGYEKNVSVSQEQIISQSFTETADRFNHSLADLDSLMGVKVAISSELKKAEKGSGKHGEIFLEIQFKLALIEQAVINAGEHISANRNALRNYCFYQKKTASAKPVFYAKGDIPADVEIEKRKWKLKVGNKPLDLNKLWLASGGAVVGSIPQGLPKIKTPRMDFSVMLDLLSMAVIISILGFMEAISIAKAMATRTGQRLNPNQELIGQGLANLAGSFTQCYPVSGSFSRSAVNIQSGAVTGLSSFFSSFIVMMTLLFFTPLLYHLPQSVLAAIIMMAVIGLLNIKGFIHAYQAQKYDGIIAIVSFVFTLAFAPHLDKGIMIGVALSVGYFLFRNIKPDMAILSKYTDGTYRNADRRGLLKCRHIAVVRFNNSLFFANVNYLEDKVLELVSTMKELRHIHIVCNGINELDASGEATMSVLVRRLKEKNIGLSLSGVNENVMDVLIRTHLIGSIGENNIFGNVSIAVHFLYERTHRGSAEGKCPLKEVVTRGLQIPPEVAEAFKKEGWTPPPGTQKLDTNQVKINPEKRED